MSRQGRGRSKGQKFNVAEQEAFVNKYLPPTVYIPFVGTPGVSQVATYLPDNSLTSHVPTTTPGRNSNRLPPLTESYSQLSPGPYRGAYQPYTLEPDPEQLPPPPPAPPIERTATATNSLDQAELYELIAFMSRCPGFDTDAPSLQEAFHQSGQSPQVAFSRIMEEMHNGDQMPANSREEQRAARRHQRGFHQPSLETIDEDENELGPSRPPSANLSNRKSK